MTILLNMGRLAMLGWVVYGLVLIFAPSILHQPPDQMSGIIQVVVAYTVGYLLDRALSILRRRKAALEAGTPSANDSTGI